MRFIKEIFQFYIFSNLHVALAVFCLVKITLLETGISENQTPAFVFFSTVIAYNLIRFLRYSDLPRWIRTWLKGHKKLLVGMTVFSSMVVLVLSFKMNLKALLWLFPFGLFTLFYAIPMPFKNETLRKIPGIKIFLIAISFAGITVIFPLAQNEVLMTKAVWIQFIQRFVFVILVTIPFDIRDMTNDVESLKTIPQKFGINWAKIIGIVFGLLFFLLELYKSQSTSKDLIVISLVTVISISFLVFATEKQVKYYSSFWVEAIPIYWLLIFIELN